MTVFVVVVVVVVVVLVVIVAVLCNLWSVVILKREEKSEKERISHKSCKVEERERERERKREGVKESSREESGTLIEKEREMFFLFQSDSIGPRSMDDFCVLGFCSDFLCLFVCLGLWW